YVANEVDVSTPTQLTATFLANSVPTGAYLIEVEKPGNVVILSNVFNVVSGGAPQLETNIVLPDKLGRHAGATLYVEYQNTGPVPMPAPLLTVHGTYKALMTLDPAKAVYGLWVDAPEGLSDTVQFLA